jgi:hypothetical protein
MDNGIPCLAKNARKITTKAKELHLDFGSLAPEEMGL